MSRQSLVNQVLFVAVALIVATGGFSAVFRDSLYRTVRETGTAVSEGPAQQGCPGTIELGALQQGTLEGSNIQLVSESIIDNRASRVGDSMTIIINEIVGSGRESHEPSEGVATSKSLSDSVQVTVVEVQANGNLVVEGIRRRSVSDETSWIRVFGIVRPTDVSNSNSVSSQNVSEFNIVYERG